MPIIWCWIENYKILIDNTNKNLVKLFHIFCLIDRNIVQIQWIPKIFVPLYWSRRSESVDKWLTDIWFIVNSLLNLYFLDFSKNVSTFLLKCNFMQINPTLKILVPMQPNWRDESNNLSLALIGQIWPEFWTKGRVKW